MPPTSKPLLKVTVFSDYICPYCYLGWLRLEQLRSDYELRVNWCMTEIHADSPAAGRPVTELGYSAEQWQRMRSELDELAAADAVRFGDISLTTNSHRALLLAEAAKELGADSFYALHKALFEAYFCATRNIGDEQVLRELVRGVGLDSGLPERAWSDPRYEQKLRDYALAARELQVSATPTFYFSAQPLRGLQTVAELSAAAAAATAAA